MADMPAEPSHPIQAPSTHREDDRQAEQQTQAEREARADDDPHAERPAERFGPLTLRRHVKHDGRALILYAHDGERVP